MKLKSTDKDTNVYIHKICFPNALAALNSAESHCRCVLRKEKWARNVQQLGGPDRKTQISSWSKTHADKHTHSSVMSEFPQMTTISLLYGHMLSNHHSHLMTGVFPSSPTLAGPGRVGSRLNPLPLSRPCWLACCAHPVGMK